MTTPTTNEKNKKKVGELFIPIVLLVITSIMLFVSAVFASLSFLSLNSSAATNNNPILLSNRRYALIGAIVAWLGFIVSIFLIGLNYYNFTIRREGIEKHINAKINNAFLWITIVVVSLFSLISGILLLIVTVRIKSVTSYSYTNALIASVTSLGGFIFVLIGAIAYGFVDTDVRKYFSKHVGPEKKVPLNKIQNSTKEELAKIPPIESQPQEKIKKEMTTEQLEEHFLDGMDDD